MRFEYDQGGSKPRAPNNVIPEDVEMLESQKIKYRKEKVNGKSKSQMQSNRQT